MQVVVCTPRTMGRAQLRSPLDPGVPCPPPFPHSSPVPGPCQRCEPLPTRASGGCQPCHPCAGCCQRREAPQPTPAPSMGPPIRLVCAGGRSRSSSMAACAHWQQRPTRAPPRACAPEHMPSSCRTPPASPQCSVFACKQACMHRPITPDACCCFSLRPLSSCQAAPDLIDNGGVGAARCVYRVRGCWPVAAHCVAAGTKAAAC